MIDEEHKKEEDLELIPDEEGDLSDLKEKIKDLKKKLAECGEEKKNNLAGWQRAKADFINYRNEEGRRLEDIGKFVTAGFIQDILPVLDSFDLALGHKLDQETERGILLIRSQFEDILKKRGLEEIPAVAGEQFDTEKHESIGEIESDMEEGTVAEVVQRGYLFRGRVLRPMRVRLSKPRP